MSLEDEAARRDALTYVDAHTPMAFDCGNEECDHMNRPLCRPKPKRKRSPKLDPRAKACRAGYLRALAAARKERTARDRVQAKADARQQKIDEAAEGYLELPAVVLRDGTVKSVSLETAVEALAYYLGDLCLDTETSGYWIGHVYYELRTIQLGGEEMAVVLDAADKAQQMIAEWALNKAVRVWAHSTTADACPVVKAGLITWDALWAKLYDSVIEAKLIDPTLCGSQADKLKDLARDLLREYAVSPQAEEAKNELFKAMGCLMKTDNTTPPERNGWHQVSKFAKTMIRYAGSDVLDLAAVLRVLPDLPVPQSVMERERETQAMCARAAYDGFPLDYGHIKLKISEAEQTQRDNQAYVANVTEGVIDNPSSSAVVLDYLVKGGYQLKVNRKTKKVTAGKESLEPLAAKGDELAAGILSYRAQTTKLGLLLRPLENLCTHGDSVMRPTVYTINAKTGRMSCVRPNGQQFSRQGGIRACVRCWQGYLGISADFEGCEIRVAAALSGDRQLYEAEAGRRCHRCKSEADEAKTCLCGPGKAHLGLHWLTAHTARGDGATKEDRYNAKRGTFTRLFGGGPETAADQVGTEVSVMADLFAAFNEVAPAYTAWDKWLRACYEQGMMVWRDYATGTNYCQDIPGSRHLVYQTYSGRNVYVTNGPHAAGNGAIQGTARELLVDGLLLWQHSKWGKLPVLPVHDQLISLVPEAEALEATEVLSRCMETDVLSSPDMYVHIGVDTDEPFVNWPDSS
jgi:DNA polymerase I-like protein with 3'-5' exonuclease and polymerase domains